MSEILERIQKAKENNRRNLDKMLTEYNKKAVAEMNGIPMTVTRYNDEYVMLEDGKLEKVLSADERVYGTPEIVRSSQQAPNEPDTPDIDSVVMLKKLLELDEKEGFVPYATMQEFSQVDSETVSEVMRNLSQILMRLTIEEENEGQWRIFSPFAAIEEHASGFKLHWSPARPSKTLRKEVERRLSEIVQEP